MSKSTKEFDLKLLEELKALKNVLVEEFDERVKKIMRKKSYRSLWHDNKPVHEWDGEKYRYANYRCCPSSTNAYHYFCLVLDRQETGICVVDGFLSAV